MGDYDIEIAFFNMFKGGILLISGKYPYTYSKGEEDGDGSYYVYDLMPFFDAGGAGYIELMEKSIATGIDYVYEACKNHKILITKEMEDEILKNGDICFD